MSDTPISKPQPAFGPIITTSVLVRIIIGAASQVFFPFLPLVAAGIGISEVRLGQIFGQQSFVALLAPFFGNLADRWGYKRVIMIGLALSSVGSFLIYLSQSLPLFVVGLLLIGTGASASHPNIAAYVSHILPFERRSRGLGILEYGWALVSLIALPIFGVLIGWFSWRTPFLLLGLFFLLSIIGFGLLPTVVQAEDNVKKEGGATISLWQRAIDFFDLGPNWRSALSTLFASIILNFAGLVVSFTFGIWLVREYGFEAQGLGGVALLFGLADLSGSSMVSWIGDRLGKKRSVMVSSIVGVLFYLILPLWNVGLVPVIIGLWLARWMFEFAIVASIVQISEQTPDRRGKIMTFRMALSTLATFLAASFAPTIYETYGVSGVSLVGAASLLLGFLITALLTVEKGMANDDLRVTSDE